MSRLARIYLLCPLVLLIATSVWSQDDFYDINHVPEIRIYFEESNWDEILDSLYIVGDEARLRGNVIIDGAPYLGVGIRYKGYSSYSPNRDKNPFNLDLDYTYQWQEHQGFRKLKLSNVIQDPSFVREALSYKIARNYMPASEANFANVYVNDTLKGVYTNVEAVNSDFNEKHFLESGNTFVKCNPETVSLNGANSNLELISGGSMEDYYALYDVKSTNVNDWLRLYEFIEVLNDDPQNIDAVLNIDRALWMHALNYVLINFDSYIGYAQNYYLYRTSNGQFQPILWDMNMSFASYRLTDASDNWDGFTIEEAKTIDPLQHLNSFSVHERPLIRHLLENDTYKRMYLAHIKTIVEECINSDDYYDWAEEMQSIIETSVLNDTNKFYSDQAFYDNLDSTVTDFVEYPGIKDLMEGRANYLMNYPGMNHTPIIQNVNEISNSGLTHDDLWITAEVQSNMILNVYCQFKSSEDHDFEITQMYDDGNHNDGQANDKVYGAFFEDPMYQMDYFIYAENDSIGAFSPARAAYEFYTVDLEMTQSDLVINEVMIENSFLADEYGETEAWLEIFAPSTATIQLNELELKSQTTGEVWALPSSRLPGFGYQNIWLDGDTLQGEWHASLECQIGDTLLLQYPNGTIVDQVIIKSTSSQSSYARYPNGTGDFTELKPTPKSENLNGDEMLTDQLFAYPNPATSQLTVRLNKTDALIQLWSNDGRVVREQWGEMGAVTMNLDGIRSGAYLLTAKTDNYLETKRILIQK